MLWMKCERGEAEFKRVKKKNSKYTNGLVCGVNSGRVNCWTNLLGRGFSEFGKIIVSPHENSIRKN